MFVCLFVCLSVCLFVCLFVSVFVCFFVSAFLCFFDSLCVCFTLQNTQYRRKPTKFGPQQNPFVLISLGGGRSLPKAWICCGGLNLRRPSGATPPSPLAGNQPSTTIRRYIRLCTPIYPGSSGLEVLGNHLRLVKGNPPPQITR